MVICPFCLSIFPLSLEPGEDCPKCESEEALEDYEAFEARPRTSFMWTFLDEQESKL